MKWSNVNNILERKNKQEQKALRKIIKIDKFFIILMTVTSLVPALILFYLLWSK